MTAREQFVPGPANVAQVQKHGDKWTLVLVRELGHAPEKVWQALTARRGRPRHAAHAVEQHPQEFHLDGRRRLAHLLRRDGSVPRR